MPGRPINHTLLRAFHLVAEAGSFTRAARASGTSQPTLSSQVRKLEATYGVSLFNRQGRRTTMTPLGQGLFAITMRLFSAEDEGHALLAGSQATTHGHLRVAADSATHVMPLLAELRRRHSGITFSLRVGNSSDVLQYILDYDADIAVMAKRTSDPRIYSVHLRTDRLVLFVPQTHPWARRSHVSIQELNGRELVIRERGSITREVFETRLAESGVRPGALFEVQTREAVHEAVAAGFGIGIVFEAEMADDPTIQAVSIDDAELSVDEYVVCMEERRHMSLVRSFLKIARPEAVR
jgi:LysR family transcriptional regulator, low CO2-responsive transcriptional regulator